MKKLILAGALSTIVVSLSLLMTSASVGSTETHIINVASNQLATRDFSDTPVGSWHGATDAPAGGFQKTFTVPAPSSDPLSIRVTFTTENSAIWLWENLSDTAMTDLWALTRVDHRLHTRDFSTTFGGPVPSGQILNPIWFMVVHSAYAHDFSDAPDAQPFDGVIDGLGPSGWIRQCLGQAPYGQPTPCNSSVMDPTSTNTRIIYWYQLNDTQKDQWRAGKLFYYAPEVSFVGTPYTEVTIPWETTHDWWNFSDVLIIDATLQVDYNF
jgi:hypothetical protein